MCNLVAIDQRIRAAICKFCKRIDDRGSVAVSTALVSSILIATMVSGSALTIIFSGTSESYTHAPIGGGTLNVWAPTSGVWCGVAIYQDPSLATGIDIAAAGNSPTWDISGLAYLPNSNVTFNGAVNKSSYGAPCLVLLAYTIYVAGAGPIIEKGVCDTAGLAMPYNTAVGRGALVE